MRLGLGKPALSSRTADLIFSSRTQMNYQISQESTRLEWSALAGCFSQAQWQSVLASWSPNGALVSLEMAVCNCTALRC